MHEPGKRPAPQVPRDLSRPSVVWHPAERRRYDVVLMDVQTPILDGIGATRAIRGLPGYGSVPILAMTANAFEEDKRTCIEAGMNDFVAQPVDPEMRYTGLLRWLGGGQSGADRVMAAAAALVAGLRRQEARPTIGMSVERLMAELAMLLDGFRRVLANWKKAAAEGDAGASGN